ncbi:MAG: hypothetical protein ACREMY_18605, partial [bacterium]
MGVKLDWNLSRGFQDYRNQGSRPLRREQTADIFEADAPGLGRGGFPGFLRVVFIRVARRHRVDQIGYRIQV